MNKKDIKERIKNIKGNNTFYLVECNFKNGEIEGIQEVIGLEDGRNNLIIDNMNSTILTDKEGNTLKDFRDVSTRKEYKINYVDKNDIMISEYYLSPRKMPPAKEINTVTAKYKLIDGKLKKESEFIKDRDSNLNIRFVANNILLIQETGKKNEAYLYSLTMNDKITPVFKYLKQTDNKEIFMFTDEIESNETINNQTEKSNIIGFIDIDGNFLNEVYDESINYTIQVNLNRDPDFMQYNSLKRSISRKLDAIVDKKINIMHNKNQAIKSLELKANKKK